MFCFVVVLLCWWFTCLNCLWFGLFSFCLLDWHLFCVYWMLVEICFGLTGVLTWFAYWLVLFCRFVCFVLIYFGCGWVIVIVIWFWFASIVCFRCCLFVCCFDFEHLCFVGCTLSFGCVVGWFDLICLLLLCVWLVWFVCRPVCCICIMGFFLLGLPTCLLFRCRFARDLLFCYGGSFGFGLFCLVAFYLICF